jgi:hypothetical protein
MMIENKQTAVEWLIEQIDDIYLHSIYGKEFEQAKEMEKQQIMDAYNNGDNRSAELYYNETFKSE